MDLSFNIAVLAVADGLLFGLYGSDRTDELFINYKRSFIIKVMVSVDIKHYDYLLTNYWGQYYNTFFLSLTVEWGF